MAIYTGIFRKTKGNVGDIAFRNQGGQTVMSERIRSNSSAGDGATYNQRVQRCKLANIVNIYKVIRRFEAKAWENKSSRVSDYNMFAKKNLPTNEVYLPKTYANVGACRPARYMVAQGSLPQVLLTWLGGPAVTNVALGGLVIDATTTVGALSEAVIAANSDFENGDKLTFANLVYQGITVGGTTLPGLVAEYIEFELNTASADLVQSNLATANASLVSSNDKLAMQLQGVAAMVVHTREINGKLYTSTQYMVTESTSTANPYGTEEWIRQCADSYGYQPTVLIQPGSVADEVEGTTYFTVAASAIGEGVVSGAGRYPQGSTVTLTAEADSGYRLKGWYDNAEGEGDALSTAQSYTISDLQANVTVYAVIEEQGSNEVTITVGVAGGGGQVSGGGTYTIGDTVTLTATPNNDYQFMGWSDGNSQNPRTFVAATDMNITASFLDLSQV